MKTRFVPVKLSLADLLGAEYIHAVCRARAFLTGEAIGPLEKIARAKADFFPAAYQRRMAFLLARAGEQVIPALDRSAQGATSREFASHSSPAQAPVGGLGLFRIGEGGRLFLSSKSAHYHTPLGHDFPGYRLIEHARMLGIPNATHNNTRGHITRLAETELVRAAAGIAPGDAKPMARLLASKSPTALNRVLNLETGSLAAEAALKMMLARFYRPQANSPTPPYEGRIPVFIVLGDDSGGLQANYHGTTVLTQIMRGMWPEFRAALGTNESFLVQAIRPNVIEDIERALVFYERNKFKVAGFFHEFVMMNYGATRLGPRYVKRAYALCRKHDVPVAADEIQTCVWSPGLYMFREYGVKPAFVIVGKGFPGGEYAGSRVLFSAAMDTLPQFGALVTNGQEELTALAYLITMRWAEANTEPARAIGEHYEERVRGLGAKYSGAIRSVEGRRHLIGIYFHELEKAKRFTSFLNAAGLDISVQTYKEGCPPSALTKLPLIAGYDAVDRVVRHMADALARL